MDDLAALVDEHAAVAVAVERDAEVARLCERTSCCSDRRRRRAAAAVDVVAVGFGRDARSRARPSRPSTRGPTRLAAAVGAVERDRQPVEAQTRGRLFDAGSRGSVASSVGIEQREPAIERRSRAARASAASICISSSSESFSPSPEKTLMPLSSAGLCEALTASRRAGNPRRRVEQRQARAS